MKSLTKSILIIGVLGIFLCSFLFATTFLNENVYIKQFGVELFICLTSSFLCFMVLIKKDRLAINLTIIDIITILLLLFYTGFLLFQNFSPQKNSLPFYYGLLYLMVLLVVRTFKKSELYDLKNAFLTLVPVVVIVHVIIVILQQIHIFPRLHGYFNNGSTFGNPDMLGTFIAVLLPFCFIQEKGWKLVGYFAFLIGIILFVFIQARSALLALTLCSILWLTLNRRIGKKQIFIVASLFVLLLGLLIVWYPESVYGRFFVWVISISMIIEHPLGWGVYSFEKHFTEFQASFLIRHQNITRYITPDVVHSPFNEFLSVGVSMGIFGLIIVITLVVIIFYYAIKAKSQLIYPLFVFFVFSLLYFPLKIAPLMVLIIPMLAVISSNSKALISWAWSLKSKRIIFCTLFLLTILLCFSSLRSYSDFKKWQTAVILSKKPTTLSESETLFANLYPQKHKDGRFLITYANLKYNQDDKNGALKLLEEAELYFCDISLSLKLAKLYQVLGNCQKAEEKYNLAINIAPDRFTAAYEKILYLIEIGKYEKAYNESKKLINKPIKQTTYADPDIIKSRLRKFIAEYEDRKTITTLGNTH